MTEFELKRRVLITVPDPKASGGVSLLFQALKLDQEPNCKYFNIQSGKRMKAFRVLGIPIMYCAFFLNSFRYKVIHLNPSLNRKSYYREMLILLIAKLMSCKVIVYWHGWQNGFEAKIKSGKLSRILFLKTYGRADLSIVLGIIFKQKLSDLGCRNKILIETNSFDDTYLKSEIFDKNRKITNPVRLLFLSRINKQKGIYTAIDTHNVLINKGYGIELTIAGEGDELRPAMKYVNDNGIKNINFTGHVSGLKKHRLLNDSHILLFPSHTEGLPLTILEAMAYGLPVISRPVGGIPDIIKNGENGYLIESLSPADYARVIELLINDFKKYEEISTNNFKQAITFNPGSLRMRLIDLYNNV